MSDVWIVDFGSQYTQLITRKARELGYSSVIITVDDAFEKIDKGETPLAFILSGGPHSVFEDKTDYTKIFKAGRPLLGICYGMQLIGQYHNGVVEKGEVGDKGEKGEIGEQGPVGERGERGEKGIRGRRGDVGPKWCEVNPDECNCKKK